MSAEMPRGARPVGGRGGDDCEAEQVPRLVNHVARAVVKDTASNSNFDEDEFPDGVYNPATT